MNIVTTRAEWLGLTLGRTVRGPQRLDHPRCINLPRNLIFRNNFPDRRHAEVDDDRVRTRTDDLSSLIRNRGGVHHSATGRPTDLDLDLGRLLTGPKKRIVFIPTGDARFLPLVDHHHLHDLGATTDLTTVVAGVFGSPQAISRQQDPRF